MLEMNNIKSNKGIKDSPKTPGGISKSFLTPIRRVGLSRNFRKSGSSPFVSPLSNTSSVETKPENESRKRKSASTEHEVQSIPEFDLINNDNNSPLSSNTKVVDINRTPTRNLLPRKKSKTLLLSKECTEESENIPQVIPEIIDCINACDEVDVNQDTLKCSKVSKLSRASSINVSVYKLPKTNENKEELNNTEVSVCVENNNTESIIEDINENICKEKENCLNNEQVNTEQKSPNNLTKECVVVIQKKIFKSLNTFKSNNEDNQKIKPIPDNTASQALFDSDTDDVPLITLNKKELEKKIKNVALDDDDDFQESKKVLKLQSKTTSITGLKVSKAKEKKKLKIIKPAIKIQNTPSSQSSVDEDDDFEFGKKKTILIKKTYNKPLKAKSTGSITQKDIDEMKERIEAKKKLLLAKSMTNETLELRCLIKKWQKGCHNALTELLELMKKKMPEKQNMEYSEILQILKIPPDLVGYDSENDCFNTPNDESIVLSDFNV